MSKTIDKKPRAEKIPSRSEVAVGDTWDLSTLYPSDAAWEKDFKKYEKEYSGYADFQGKLKDSAETIADCLKFDVKLDILAERLGTYAFLKTTEDQSNSDYQALAARFRSLSSKSAQLASFIRPELLAIPKAKMDQFLKADCLAEFKLVLQRIVRYRAHTLSHKEERLLAMQSEMAGTAGQTFRQLNDADLKFGTVKNELGQTIELSNASLSSLLQSPKRSVRKTAFHQYYDVHQAHENTLAATLAGSVHGDVYYAKARGYPSALESALFSRQRTDRGLRQFDRRRP